MCSSLCLSSSHLVVCLAVAASSSSLANLFIQTRRINLIKLSSLWGKTQPNRVWIPQPNIAFTTQFGWTVYEIAHKTGNLLNKIERPRPNEKPIAEWIAKCNTQRILPASFDLSINVGRCLRVILVPNYKWPYKIKYYYKCSQLVDFCCVSLICVPFVVRLPIRKLLLNVFSCLPHSRRESLIWFRFSWSESDKMQKRCNRFGNALCGGRENGEQNVMIFIYNKNVYAVQMHSSI